MQLQSCAILDSEAVDVLLGSIADVLLGSKYANKTCCNEANLAAFSC